MVPGFGCGCSPTRRYWRAFLLGRTLDLAYTHYSFSLYNSQCPLTTTNIIMWSFLSVLGTLPLNKVISKLSTQVWGRKVGLHFYLFTVWL
jgi:hypothetical protein